MEGHSEGVQDEVDIVIYVRRRLVLGAADVVVVVLEDIYSGSLGEYVRWLDGGIQLDRVNDEKIIFFMCIMNRERDMIYPTCDMVGFNDVNNRLDVLIDGGLFVPYCLPTYQKYLVRKSK